MAGFKNNAVNSKKQKNRMKKRNRKTNKQIKKLFESLRNESFTSQGPSDNITLDSTNNTTVIVLDDTIKSPNKRKLSETSFADKASKKIDRSAVVTDDVVIQSDSEPCHSAGKKIGEENSVVITDDDLQVNKKPCDFSNKKRTETAATDSVIITDEVLPTTAESNSGQQHNAINSTEPVIIKDDETLQFIPVPSSSKTPRKKHIAPPMNCSTPIARANSSIVSNNNADSTKNLNTDVNQTKVINRDSFLTIDLTTESDLSRQYNTVIDLENTQDSPDCSFVSISNASSMSGDSQVTVLRGPNKHSKSSDKQINKFVNGISKLDASDKGRLLELITKNIFNGCKIPEKLKRINISNTAESSNQAPEPAENTYIKEVILGQKQSRNSIGSNIYNPEKDDRNKSGLRMVVIDGSNVAMQHGMGRVFSVRGLKICIDYFLKRGHVVKAFVPRFRCKFGRSSEPSLLSALEKRGLVVFTPSREVRGKTITSYDDRYIVQCAAEFDGVIVSGDNYRDLLQENPRWRFVIENRLLQFTWVNDMIMFPRDPLGRNGPSLEEFLRHPVPKIAL